MRLLKLIGKILLLPVVLLLGILRLLVKIGMEVSSFILGALMLIVFGCIIFTIIQHTWNSMWILIVMEVFLVMITAGTGVIQGVLDVRQTTSYELQKKYYEDFVRRHPNWTLVKIYADEGISGTSLKHRDAFNEMIEHAG